VSTIGYFTDTVEVDVPITDRDLHRWAKKNPEKARAVLVEAGPVVRRTDTLARALEDWHNAEHSYAFRSCDNPVCKEANRVPPDRWDDE
jgi:hypothetical protein